MTCAPLLLLLLAATLSGPEVSARVTDTEVNLQCRSGLQVNGTRGRLLGGVVASSSQFPFMVLVRAPQWDGSTHLCGGSLLSEMYVLTSAQCVARATQIQLTAGVLSASATDGQSRNGIAIVYPNFRYPTLQHDIALVKALNPFTISGTVRPVFVPGGNIQGLYTPNKLQGRLVRALGYGPATTTGDLGALNYVDQRQMTRSECDTEMLGAWVLYPPSMDCLDATEATKGHCFGDRGGPVLLRVSHFFVQIGVLSHYTACPSTYPSAYTRLLPYVSWISSYVSDLTKFSTKPGC